MIRVLFVYPELQTSNDEMEASYDKDEGIQKHEGLRAERVPL